MNSTKYILQSVRIMHYILIFDRTTGRTKQIISEPDSNKAYELFKSLDYEYSEDLAIEVNYLTARDDADLKKVFRRFFLFE